MSITKRMLSFLLAFAMVISVLPVAGAAKTFEKKQKWEDGDFSDIPAEEWFSQNVADAFELGLMKGAGNKKFNPHGNISLAETITVAARIHSLATTGEENFVQGNPWYSVYAEYALANGIISSIPENIMRRATRLEFAEILANAMNDEDLSAINTIDDGIIPDVASNASVYKLYRAGVLTGGDDKGTFSPDSSISRAEVSAIIARMALPETRIKRDLKKEEEKKTDKKHSYGGGGGGGSSSGSKPNQPAKDKVSANIEVDDDGKVKNEVSMSGDKVNATVPAGVSVDEGAKKLTLTVEEMKESGGNIETGDDETLSSYDVHIDGISAENTVAIKVFLGDILPIGMNIGNITLYHVENEETNAMTQVSTLDELDEHNEFYYDPVTGNVTVALANFSEVAVVAEDEKAWKGNFDYSWYDASKTELTIANADQLAAFGAIVGGMNGQIQDSFSGKTVKLVSDVNLGDKESENNPDLIFYPIGYYNSTGSYKKVSGASVTSSVSSFEGTFDGNGHTIANFYQNTWEMFGDYDGTYYKDAMGLFGYVVNGTVKNLTVDNFSSDGEYTPTGVIAAYACNSTFENIAITNCNPRVYNTGNGGIVGIGGNTSDPDTYKLTFTNITIDNSNKITALWGSWDVACGGLVGMFRGAGHVYMTNCHVASQIDVYNDVCGNYQYYWYRYSGMMVGTNKNMVTDKDGYTVPETSKFHAEGCTVHFGNWNDYYYCELVANTLASYTHDHQFSRLEQVDSVDVEKKTVTVGDKTTAIPTSGRCNYVVVKGSPATENATCYHFVNGEVWNHADAGTETVGGVEVLKENNQHIYLPFNQLFTGYGWGVKHIPVYNGEDYAFEGITILDRETADSVEKFEGKVTELANNTTYKLGDIFTFVDNGVELISSALTVTVTNLDENLPVSATFNRDTDNWENGTITFEGIGMVQLTIQDYHFCKPTTINVTVKGREPEEKFDVVMNNGNFLHRVGNSGTVALDKLFKAKDGAEIGTVSVTIEALNGTSASGSYTSNATWSNGTIQFSDTGVVKVTIKDDDKYCTPTELLLEVVDAVNATGAASATKNNIVLLDDCGFSSLEVSGGYTLYGNGFTMTCGSDSVALDTGYSFVTLNNGTLDNVQIVCPNFDYAVLYKSNMTESGNRWETTDRTRYYNVKSGVMASGNSQILNSRISGARAAVNVTGGNLIIDNSRIELGAVASLLVGSANSLTLRDVTLVQKPTASTHDSSKTLMGFSVLTICDTNGDSTPITLEGTLVQNAWIDEEDTKYVPEDGQSIIESVLGKTDYLHDLNGDGTNESLNLGFAYMPETATSNVNATTITDNRSDKSSIVYDYTEIPIVFGKTYVYSYKNTNGTADSFKTESEYVPNKYGDIITVNYSDTSDGLTTGKSFGTDGWVYELNVDLDKLSGYALDFNKVSMTVNGVAVTDFKVNGSAKPTSPVAVTAGGTTYTLTATVDGKEYTSTYKVTGTETSKESPSLVSKNYADGFGVSKSYGGDWSAAVSVLDGITIKYWSVADNEYKNFPLSSITFADTGKQNGTNSYWEYTHTNNDFTLKLTNTIAIHSGKSVFGMPVVAVDGNTKKLYFTISSTNGFVGTGTTSRSITIQYEFTDNNGGEALTFTKSWNISYDKNNQYNYDDLCNGTLTKLEASGGGTNPCFTPDTLITLADGRQKRIDEVTYEDKILTWDFFKGEYTEQNVCLLVNHGESLYQVINIKFSDDTILKIVGEHGIFDYDLNKFIYITPENAEEYIGHRFVKANTNGGYDIVTLNDAYVTEEYTDAYSITSAYDSNAFAEGMLTLAPPDGFYNWIEMGDTLTYDVEKFNADVEKYGLYTYEDFADYVTYEQFIAFNGAYLKIPVEKGLFTFDYILELIDLYLS